MTLSTRLRLWFKHAAPALPIVPVDDPHDALVFERCTQPRISIVIPVHDHWPITHQCMRAVLEHTARDDFEVILADDHSSDDTLRATSVVANLRLVRQDERTGFIRNCNDGTRVARGELLVLLNNDTVVQPGWLDALVDTMDDDSGIAIAGAKLVHPDGRLQEAGGLVSGDGSAVRRGHGEDPASPDHNVAADTDYVSACCLIVRSSLWHDIGGFDERYSPGYYEDVDLAFSARARGFRVVYQPRAVVMHYEGLTYGRDRSAGIDEIVSVNREAFREKWASVLESDFGGGAVNDVLSELPAR